MKQQIYIYFTNSQNSKIVKNRLNEIHQKSHKPENQEFKFFNFCPPPYSEKSFENPIFSFYHFDRDIDCFYIILSK